MTTCEKHTGRKASFEGFGHRLCWPCYQRFVADQRGGLAIPRSSTGQELGQELGAIRKPARSSTGEQMTLGDNWRRRGFE